MEKNLSCIIVDDEPLAQELIEKFVKRINTLTLLGIFDNAIEALEQVDTLKPDIIFLDINMPEMTGIEFIRSFTKSRPHIILTTAYPQYAVDGFEYDVVDYLLKPIPFDRFVRAINKVKDKVLKASTTPASPAKNLTIEEENVELIDEGTIRDNFLWVKEDRKLVKIDFNDIVYVEGMKDYLKIFLPKTMIITHMTMSRMEGLLLARKKFLRINRSFIVNTKYMSALDGNEIVLESGKKLMIGITYRDIIKNAMKSQLV